MLIPYRSLLLAALLAGLSTVDAAAHEVQIAEDVGATLHIEPNDIARAGTPTDLWFALTQAGGTMIPLADCDCRLTLYDNAAKAIATPDLSPVSAEGFQEIPGATVTFPDVGSYELVLSGSPAAATQFSPFELRFEVTVASRAAGTSSPEVAAADSPAAVAESGEAPAPSGEPAAAAENPTDPAAETAIAPVTETPTPTSTSTIWTVAAVVGGAIVIVGLGIAFIGGRRSPGGKQ